MRKLIPILLILLSSCATYTIQDGYNAINLPDESGPKLETRYRLIQAAKEAEGTSVEVSQEPTVPAIPEAEENTAAEAEPIVLPAQEEPVIPAEPETSAEENAKTEEAGETETESQPIASEEPVTVHYPENLSDITFPYLYTLSEEPVLKDGNIITAKVLLLDLGYSALSENDLERILSSVADTEPDFIVLNGSLENQRAGAETAGMNAVTLKGGTVLYSSRIEFADDESAVFSISQDKEIEIIPISYPSNLPSKSDEISSWITSIKERENAIGAAVMTSAGSTNTDSALLALSSPSPSTQDWSSLTQYQYRYPESFTLSDSLENAGWRDAYRDTHFSTETDSGITDFNGDVYERMDFLYIKNMMPEYAVSFPVAGLTDTAGSLGLIAEFVIP